MQEVFNLKNHYLSCLVMNSKFNKTVLNFKPISGDIKDIDQTTVPFKYTVLSIYVKTLRKTRLVDMGASIFGHSLGI